MPDEKYREQYAAANRYRGTAFLERPYIGSPGAPAQAETNVSGLWGHVNGGFLIGYEYTRWWHECHALRNAAVLGDWSWLNKVMVRGPRASEFLAYASVKDVSRQQVGQVLFTPMVNAGGKVAIEGLTFRLDEETFLFTQSGAQMWLRHLRDLTGIPVELEDVTPDYTCFALQGPRSTAVLEAVTGRSFGDLAFSRFRTVEILGEEVMVDRQGVTGEVGYELLMPTAGGRAHELWRLVRDAGRELGLRELGLRAQMVGHVETGIPSAIRDYLPARMSAERLRRFLRLWTSREELALVGDELTEHWCTPGELGWQHTVDLDGHDFLGRAALEEEARRGGPARRLVGLTWSGEDMTALYGALFRDDPSPPPPELPCGQYRMQFLPVMKDGRRAGWASGATYSPALRRMISLARIDGAVDDGSTVLVRWGGFSSEERCLIRAEVSPLPFIPRERRRDLGTG